MWRCEEGWWHCAVEVMRHAYGSVAVGLRRYTARSTESHRLVAGSVSPEMLQVVV